MAHLHCDDETIRGWVTPNTPQLSRANVGARLGLQDANDETSNFLWNLAERNTVVVNERVLEQILSATRDSFMDLVHDNRNITPEENIEPTWSVVLNSFDFISLLVKMPSPEAQEVFQRMLQFDYVYAQYLKYLRYYAEDVIETAVTNLRQKVVPLVAVARPLKEQMCLGIINKGPGWWHGVRQQHSQYIKTLRSINPNHRLVYERINVPNAIAVYNALKERLKELDIDHNINDIRDNRPQNRYTNEELVAAVDAIFNENPALGVIRNLQEALAQPQE